MKYLHYLIDESEGSNKIFPKLLEITRDNAVIKNFKSKGYTIYAIETGIHTLQMKNADFRLCTEDDLTVTEFHTMLIRTTALNPIQGQIFSGDHREQTLCEFSELSEMANRNDSPKFVFAHLNIPHNPYVFGPNGEPLISKILTLEAGKVDPKNQHLYLGQLQFVNIKMKEVIEKLTAIENPPIIIIQSDHGARLFEYENEYEEKLSYLNNFKAYYFPDEGRNIEFETTTPVNSFRVLFNLLFDDEYELLEDRIYMVKLIKRVPAYVTDVTDILINNNSEN